MIKAPFKLRIFFWSLLAISSTLSATQPLLEIKTGYFFFSDSKMRKVYDKGGLDVQLSASYPLLSLNSGWILSGYGALEYFHRSGKSINGDQKTSLWSIPINLGIKPVYAISSDMHYYFAIGPRYFYIHQHNDSPYLYRSKSKNGLGLFVNTGFNYLLEDNVVIDLFGEYSYAKMRFHGRESNVYTRRTQVGGFTLGGALGYAF